MKINKLRSILIAISLAGSTCFLSFSPMAHANNTPSSHQTVAQPKTAASSDALSPTTLKYAVNAYRWAIKHNDVHNPSVLTIVDFNMPSYEKRLWVIDLKNDRVLLHTYVAQGRNTGAIYAKHFSNQPGSLESSPGIFTTSENKYSGEHGESLRIHGLEAGINSNVYDRSVVIHGAPYVTPAFIKQNGYAGRSWGCFAVNPSHVDHFINLIHGGSVLFAYAAPEKNDPLVDHRLSSAGQALYDAILHKSTSHWF